MSDRVVGIDVGARELHCAALEVDGAVAESAVIAANDLDELQRWCDGARAIAIDAPDAASTAPHRDDASLAAKFRLARCAEIELGRRRGCWVSWATPAAPPFPGWMETGFAVFAALRALPAELLEVYPYAGFRELAGGRRLRNKQTAAGRRERAELLARAGVAPRRLTESDHDELDAMMAATIAMHRLWGTARPITCGHDGSAIWLPRT